MFREMYAGQFFNTILWQNDPDVIYLRDYKTRLTSDEKTTLALWSGIMGGTITTSCRFHTLDGGWLKLWRFVKPGKTHQSGRLPFWGGNDSLLTVVRIYPETGGKAVLFVNPTNQHMHRAYNMIDLTGWETGFAFRWRTEEYLPLGQLRKLAIDLEPHASALFYIAENDHSHFADMNLSGILTNGRKTK
jgi:hypothetical protein